jgi:hypothetical protein
MGGALLSFVACNGGGTYDYYYDGWYNVYGQECGSLGPGCNYWSDGLKIVDYEDPYYDGGYIWDEYYSYYYGTYVWESPSGIIYDEWGYALNRNGVSINRDLIADVGQEQETMIKSAASKFAAKYSLSNEVGLKVAKTLNTWSKLGFTQGRTTDDLKNITKELYGVDFDEAESALKDAVVGQKDKLNKLVNTAAQNWGTNPETMREILNDFHGNQLKVLGATL